MWVQRGSGDTVSVTAAQVFLNTFPVEKGNIKKLDPKGVWFQVVFKNFDTFSPTDKLVLKMFVKIVQGRLNLLTRIIWNWEGKETLKE